MEDDFQPLTTPYIPLQPRTSPNQVADMEDDFQRLWGELARTEASPDLRTRTHPSLTLTLTQA